MAKNDKNNVKVDILPESDEVLVLTADDGSEVEFAQIACIEYNDEFFALLQPVTPLEGFGEDEVAIFKIVEEDEETDTFMPVEDEELLDNVFAEYLRAVSNLEEGGGGCGCGCEDCDDDCDCDDEDCDCEDDEDCDCGCGHKHE